MSKYFRTYLLLILCCLMEMATAGQDTLNLSGRILGINDQPVSGVSVSVEGITEPAITGQDGSFSLLIPSGDAWIMISPLDQYKAQRIFISKRTNLIVRLTPLGIDSPDDQLIDLFETKSRKHMPGSVDVPDPAKNFHFPYESVDQSFQGDIPGLMKHRLIWDARNRSNNIFTRNKINEYQ